MERLKTIKKIVGQGIVAVVRTESEEQGIKTVDAIYKGGIKTIEITMVVPRALDIIKKISRHYKDKNILIGAGTVLDPETARICILAGAKYIVSPNLNIETLKLCNRYRIPSIPGITTPKEAIEAMEYGAEIIKLFPSSAFNPSIIKDFKGPLPQLNLMPTGGVSLDSIKDWFEAGAIAVGIGSHLTKGAKIDDYELVYQTAMRFVEEVARWKRQGVA